MFREISLIWEIQDCTIAQPTILDRIGLRYINDVAFDETTVELEDYFELYPYLKRSAPRLQLPPNEHVNSFQ